MVLPTWKHTMPTTSMHSKYNPYRNCSNYLHKDGNPDQGQAIEDWFWQEVPGALVLLVE